MEIQFQYITDLATQYKQLSEQPAALYKALNDLPQDALQDIFNEYGSPENDFKSVNLLCAEVARQLLNGIIIDEQVLEFIEERIRQKDLSYFTTYSEDYIRSKQLAETSEIRICHPLKVSLCHSMNLSSGRSISRTGRFDKCFP